MNSLMYILVSLPKFILLTFLKGRETVTSPIIFPNENKTCSYDKNPLLLAVKDIHSRGANCLRSTAFVSKKCS